MDGEDASPITLVSFPVRAVVSVPAVEGVAMLGGVVAQHGVHPGQPAAMTDVAFEDSEETVKLELGIASPPPLSVGVRKRSDATTQSSTSSAKRVCQTTPMVSGGSLAASDSVAGEEGIKMELGISGLPS